MRWIEWMIAAAFAIVIAVTAGIVRAQDCPAPTPQSPATTCKVITITPLEEQALTGERGILDTAAQGRPLDLMGAVNYFREKIRNAPAGKPAEKP